MSATTRVRPSPFDVPRPDLDGLQRRRGHPARRAPHVPGIGREGVPPDLLKELADHRRTGDDRRAARPNRYPRIPVGMRGRHVPAMAAPDPLAAGPLSGPLR